MSAGHSITKQDRWTKARPCPICGGYQSLHQGDGVRCYGFASGRAGEWANCTREEHAGTLRPQGTTYGHKMQGNCACGLTHDGSVYVPNPTVRIVRDTPLEAQKGVKEIIYAYTDAGGNLLYNVVRVGFGKTKKIRQRRPDGKGAWLYDLDGVPRVLYRLPDLLAADPAETIYIVEGERDAETLRGWGVLGTTNAMGAGHWLPDYTETLRGRNVVIVPDHDVPGERHARTVAAALDGVAASIRILRLPGITEPGGDVTDWAAMGGTGGMLRALSLATPAYETPRGGLQLLTVADILALPAPEMLIDEILPAHGLSVLYAAPGAGKSFLALDWAFRVALGMAWFGLQVQKGPVIYVAAEGKTGLGIRVRAWMDRFYSGAVPSGIFFIPHPIYPAHDGTGQSLAEAIASAGCGQPALIVLDTLARCNDGDENSTTDMTKLIAAIDAIRAETGAAVLLIHHKGHTETRIRGSSALLGAADAVLLLDYDKTTGVMTLKPDKMKDSAEFDTWRLVRQVVDVGDTTSCVVALAAGSTPALTDNMRQILEFLVTGGCDLSVTGSSSFGEISRALGLHNQSTTRGLLALQTLGYVGVTNTGKNGTKLYCATEGGKKAVTRQSHPSYQSNSHTQSHPSHTIAANVGSGSHTVTPPPLGGVTVTSPGQAGYGPDGMQEF